MLKTLYTFCTYLIIALGAVHIAFTPLAYDGFSLDALWFVGSGVAVIFAGLTNLILLRGAAGEDPVARWLCFATNLTLALLFAAALLVLREPQVFIGLFLSGLEAVASLLFSRR